MAFSNILVGAGTRPTTCGPQDWPGGLARCACQGRRRLLRDADTRHILCIIYPIVGLTGALAFGTHSALALSIGERVCAGWSDRRLVSTAELPQEAGSKLRRHAPSTYSNPRRSCRRCVGHSAADYLPCLGGGCERHLCRNFGYASPPSIALLNDAHGARMEFIIVGNGVGLLFAISY